MKKIFSLILLILVLGIFSTGQVSSQENTTVQLSELEIQQFSKLVGWWKITYEVGKVGKVQEEIIWIRKIIADKDFPNAVRIKGQNFVTKDVDNTRRRKHGIINGYAYGTICFLVEKRALSYSTHLRTYLFDFETQTYFKGIQFGQRPTKVFNEYKVVDIEKIQKPKF